MGKFNFDDYPDAEGAPTFDFEQYPDVEKEESQSPGFDWRSPISSSFKMGLHNLGKATDLYDEYITGPTRKLVTEAVTGKGLEKAPSGVDQAKMMSVNNEPIPFIKNTANSIKGGLNKAVDAANWVEDKAAGFGIGSGDQIGDTDHIQRIPGEDTSLADIVGTGLEMIQDPFVIGSGVKKGASLLGRGAMAATDAIRSERQLAKAFQSQAAHSAGEQVAKSGLSVAGGGLEVEQGGKLFDFKAPKSLDELRTWKPSATGSEMPGKGRLQQIEKNVPDLETKPLKYHYDMMENPKAMKELKLQFENLPTDDAKKIASYNQQIVNESGGKLRQTVNDLAGGAEPKSLTDAGYDFVGTVKDKYNAEKDALGPLFEELKANAAPISPDESRALTIAIGENTRLGKILAQDENTGKLFLNRNTPRSGVSDAEHGILKRVVDDLNDGMTFREMQDTRDFLRKSIDPANPGASEEVSKVRSILLGQMEEMAGRRGNSVGETFRAYAKNERAREAIEQVIGGKIESLDAMFAANPDKVVQKIFSNPNYAKVVGDYVGPQKMKELIGSYVQNGMKKAFDPARGFDPSAARNWLKSNATFVKAYVDPAVAERLSSLADYGYYGRRFLDEVNPSGTAASLQAMLEPKGFFQKVKSDGITGALTNEVSQRLSSAVKQKQASRVLNESLGGVNTNVNDYIMRKYKGTVPAFAKALDGVAVSAGAGATGRGMLRDTGLPRVSDEQKNDAQTFDKSMGHDAILEKTQGTKYSQVLQSASQRGPQGLSASHFILSQQDPAYRKLVYGDPEDEP